MGVARLLPALPVILLSLSIPSFAAPSTTSDRAGACMAPKTFLSALTSAGDWVIKRDPNGAGDAQVTGVAFRHEGMIDVAVFKSGCLAMVVIVGQAPPDLQV